MDKRRRFFQIVPDPSKMRIQMNYVKLIVVTQLVCIVILVVGFNATLHVLLKTAQLGRYAEMQLVSVFKMMNVLFGVVTLFSVVVGGFLSLRLSHRFIGPLYRIEKTLKDAMSSEDTPRFSIRHDDELKELIILLNDFMEKRKAKDAK